MSPENQDNIEVEFDDIISRAVSDYGDHDGVARPKIIRWIRQFPQNSRDIAVKVLDCLRYYSTSGVKSMTEQFVNIVYSHYQSINRNSIYFVPIGADGSGSQIIARYMKTFQYVPDQCVKNVYALQQVNKARVNVIVLFDDFSGTGETIQKHWEEIIEQLILPFESEIMLGLLILNYKARKKIESSFPSVLSVKYLERQDNVFHSNCTIFSEEEKTELIRLCRTTGCGNKFNKGYGNCGLLVVFMYGCPNNSLPILWHQSTQWERLFYRRTI